VALRNGSVIVLANVGSTTIQLPVGEVLLATGPLDGRTLPVDTTVWMTAV
jgi:alpha-glucosidase